MSSHRSSAAHFDVDDDGDVRDRRRPKPIPGERLKALIASRDKPLVPPISELVATAAREVALRERKSLQWLQTGDKSEKELLRDLACFRAIVAVLERLAEGERE